MLVKTTRFGTLQVPQDDQLTFPAGLIGLEECRGWVLLGDAENEALGWLQSTARPELALAVVSPRRFVPDYQFRVYRSELAPLELARPQDAHVLAIVGKRDGGITLNLKAPLVLNVARHLGRQVLANDDHSACHRLTDLGPSPLKKSA